MFIRRSFHTIIMNNKINNIKPLIFIDFDETLTTKDTISLLGQFGINYQLNSQSNNNKSNSTNTSTTTTIPTNWSYFTNTYLEDYRQVKEEEINISLPLSSSSSIVNIKEKIYLKEEPFRKVEQASLDRIASFKVLKGLTSKEWQQAGANQVQLRPHSDLIFKNNNNNNMDILNRLYIVSLNWSKDWILGALKQHDHHGHHDYYLDKSHILCNDLEFDPITHQSTGKILPSILLSNDKLKIIQSILFQHQQQIDSTIDKTTSIYIGDSMGDLLPLIECDIGIIIGRNEKLLTTLKQMEITIQDDLNIISNDTTTTKVIYRVDDWKTILNSSLLQ